MTTTPQLDPQSALQTTAADAAATATETSTAPPAIDEELADKAITAWKRVYLLFKPLETKLEAARTKVVKLLVDAGFQPGVHYVSKHGKIGLQTQNRTDWEGLARHCLSDKVIAALLPSFTKRTDPFVRAPHSWAGEAK